MISDTRKTPFPWFGGKTDAAQAVWDALGDVPHYVEPFLGGAAILLRRPHQPNRGYYSETVNDLDGLLVNAWRAIQFSPQETAEAASWPVSEFDKHARGCHLLKWRESEAAAHLAGDPTWHDPIMGGWWMWCVCVQIGAWGQGGPWWPDEEGKLRKRPRGKASEEAAAHLAGDLPFLGNDGRGVHHPGTREPGVWGNRPHLSDNGMGVNMSQAREAGVARRKTWQQIVDDDYTHTGGFHPMTMPEIRRWFDALSARLRHVRIANGDWTRVVTRGAAKSLPVRNGKGPAGIFLDPPYGDVGRVSLYGKQEDFNVAEKVREWCLENGDDPDYRIVYAGYDEEGADLVAAGWRESEWFVAGHLKGGMGNGHQQKRERLWMSPHCVAPVETPMLF